MLKTLVVELTVEIALTLCAKLFQGIIINYPIESISKINAVNLTLISTKFLCLINICLFRHLGKKIDLQIEFKLFKPI